MKPKLVGQKKCCNRYAMFTFEMEEEKNIEGSGSLNITQNKGVLDLVGVVTPAYTNYANSLY